MKTCKILFTLLFFSCFIVQAQDNKTTKENPKPTEELEAKKLRFLAKELCRHLVVTKTIGTPEPEKVIEDLILKHLSITRETKDYKLQVAEFWNNHAEDLICTVEIPGTRSPQQFMKRVIDMHMYKSVLYDFLLYDEEEYPINVNAIEIYNGEEETVLDYLDKILADPKNEKSHSFKEIKQLRRILVNMYGAKKAKDL